MQSLPGFCSCHGKSNRPRLYFFKYSVNHRPWRVRAFIYPSEVARVTVDAVLTECWASRPDQETDCFHSQQYFPSNVLRLIWTLHSNFVIRLRVPQFTTFNDHNQRVPQSFYILETRTVYELSLKITKQNAMHGRLLFQDEEKAYGVNNHQ